MNNETTLERPTLTPEVVKAEIIVSLSKDGLAYQRLLQEGENIRFTRDNFEEEQKKLAVLRKLETSLEKMVNPWTAKWKQWNENRKSLLDPVSALTAKKGMDAAAVSRELEAERQRIDAEKNRVAAIKQAIDDFFIQQSQAIAAATTPQEIVRIEKLIGSHKGNSSRYQEFLPLLQSKAANLDDLIKEQKVSIKKLEALKTAEKAAEATGDDQAILDSREAQEELATKIHENREIVQEKAIGMATQADVVEPEIIIPIIPKARRSTWKYEVVDIKAAQKAGLTKTVIDEEKIDAILAEKRKTETEVTENGIRYFVERRF